MILTFTEVAACIFSLFIFTGKNPLHGHTTFWLSSHLLKGILVIHYSHLKDEQIEAEKGNLVQGPPTCK